MSVSHRRRFVRRCYDGRQSINVTDVAYVINGTDGRGQGEATVNADDVLAERFEADRPC
jgi:hypothetical protein